MKKSPLRNIWLWTALAILIIIFDSPLLNALLTSLKADGTINSFPPKWIFKPTGQHFLDLFNGPYPFAKYFMNSIVVSIGSSLLVIVVGLPAAYSMIRLNAAKRLLGIVVSLRLLPPIVFAIPYYMLYQWIGLVDTRIGLVLLNTLFNLPLGLLLLVSFLQELPYEIEEAARVDGCGTYGILGRIVLPLLGPGIVAVMILTFVFTWNEFLFSLVLTSQHATTITVGATMFITSWGIRWGDVSAAIVLSVIPPLLFTIFLQKYLVKSLSMGAVKG